GHDPRVVRVRRGGRLQRDAAGVPAVPRRLHREGRPDPSGARPVPDRVRRVDAARPLRTPSSGQPVLRRGAASGGRQVTPHRTRLLGVAATLAVLAGLAAGCSGSADASGDGTTIRYQTSPGLMNLAEMADALGYLHGITLKSEGVVQGG